MGANPTRGKLDDIVKEKVAGSNPAEGTIRVDEQAQALDIGSIPIRGTKYCNFIPKYGII